MDNPLALVTQAEQGYLEFSGVLFQRLDLGP
jgi:hypothetical protein